MKTPLSIFFIIVFNFAGLISVNKSLEASPKKDYWAVAYRYVGSGWGSGSGQTPQEAIRRAQEVCDKTKPKVARYTTCALTRSFNTKDTACVHFFEAYSSSHVVFVGMSYGTSTSDAARDAAVIAQKQCVSKPGFTSTICGSFVRPHNIATFCSKHFR